MNIHPIVRQRILEWNYIFTLVNSYFNDKSKTVDWIFTENPLLGNVTPHTMVKMGRFQKLKSFIEESLGTGQTEEKQI